MANILEVFRVAPFSRDSPEYSLAGTKFSLPLTFFDTLWFKFLPVERLVFFSLDEPREALLTSVVPKLKHSLSQTLRNFLPLAGKLTWPKESSKPVILYRAPNDSVSFTVAEREADDFKTLVEDHPREAASFRSLVPELDVSGDGASVVSLQVTIFPGKGFCIGVTSHHAILDGKSSTMFVKSWAHACRGNSPALPPELTPFFDRSVVKDPKGLDLLFVNQWSKFLGGGDAGDNYSDPRDNPKLFELMQIPETPLDLVRATFQLSKEDIGKLRREILRLWRDDKTELRLSTFAIAFSFALSCIARATENPGDSQKLIFGFAADFRHRIDPPVPDNYFGNCVGFLVYPFDIRKMIVGGENDGAAVAAVAAVVGGLLRDMERKDDVMEGADEWLASLSSVGPARAIGVAGSPRFGVYGLDFGWGPPRKVEIASIDRTGAVSMAESRDGSGGVEIGVVLERNQVDVFVTLFSDGLKSC